LFYSNTQTEAQRDELSVIAIKSAKLYLIFSYI